MESTWNLDEIARTSDEAAVRQRFDATNRRLLVVLLIGFAFAAFLEVVTNERTNTPLDVAIGSANFALAAAALYACWSSRTRHWVSRRITGLVIGSFVLQHALGLAFARQDFNWVAWATTLPMIVLAFRMFTSELVLTHALMAGQNLVMVLFSGAGAGRSTGVLVATLSVNAVALTLNLLASRRKRRRIVDEWNERRAQAREQIRMRDELRYARELQLSMLPECAPDLDWLDICAASVPASEVGGDYYDYFVGEDHVAIVSGDVAGHGMSAGLVLAAVRAGFTILRESLSDPALVLRRLHDLVTETSRRRMLVTVSVALLHRDRCEATIASAGHPPILVRRADGRVETINLFAAPLGVRLPITIPQIRIPFEPGDVFVLHSDGIYETRNGAGEVYGLERLADALRLAPVESSDEILDAIAADVARFRGNEDLDDDMTLVIARVKHPPATAEE